MINGWLGTDTAPIVKGLARRNHEFRNGFKQQT